MPITYVDIAKVKSVATSDAADPAISIWFTCLSCFIIVPITEAFIADIKAIYIPIKGLEKLPIIKDAAVTASIVCLRSCLIATIMNGTGMKIIKNDKKGI